jgi:hypothetical protein
MSLQVPPVPSPPPWKGWTALAEHPWAYPALEAAHLVGVSAVLGALLVLHLRLLGLAKGLDVRALARLALPVVGAGFVLAASSGLLMFSSQPMDLLANRSFVLKMGLLILAAGNAASFHARGGLQRRGLGATLQSLLSLGLWIGVIITGRWIAYT